jgi:hypothetical protein
MSFSKRTPHATLGAVTTLPQGLLDKAIERLKAEFQPEEISRTCAPRCNTRFWNGAESSMADNLVRLTREWLTKADSTEFKTDIGKSGT